MAVSPEAAKELLSRVLPAVPGWWFVRALAQEVQEDDVFGMSAEMAYRFLFALFPTLLVVSAGVGIAGPWFGLTDPFGSLIGWVAPLIPGPAHGALETFAARALSSDAGTFFGIGLVGSLWGATGGVATLIKGMNRAYGVTEPRPMWRRRLLALGLTAALPLAALTFLLLASLGDNLVAWVAPMAGLGESTAEVVALARWPLLSAVLVLVLAGVYHVFPNVQRAFTSALPGAFAAAAGWMLMTRGLDLYLSHLGDYHVTYGAAGTVMAFMLWSYLAGAVMLIGAEINGVLYTKRVDRGGAP